MRNAMTIKDFRSKKKLGEKIVALTGYDYVTAKILDQVGIDLILVGDSLGMVVMGYTDTLKVTMEEMIHHTKAVTRGVERAWVVADMPFLSYGVTEESSILNAARMIQEAGAKAVKLEGGKFVCPVIQRMTDLGIPVLGHIGMMPTRVLTGGGYHVQGRDPNRKKELLADAIALEKAGVFAIVLECMDSSLAREITKKLKIPTIGIGSGPYCDGQILVSHDLLGLYEDIKPKFVKRYAQIGSIMRKAFNAYKEEVVQGEFPKKENTY